MTNEINDSSENLSSSIGYGIIGHIKAISGGPPPDNWLLSDGSELLISHYPALFAVIGARFGGDGLSTFALPDLSGEHRFAICFAGYFPLAGAPPAEWKPASEDQEYISLQARSFQNCYAQGGDPFGQHAQLTEVDPEWLERQGQVWRDAYAQGHDPHYRHPQLTEVDPEWLERQGQVLQDAYAQGRDPFHRHLPGTEVDPEYLERQVQVLKDAYAQGHDPHFRHPHVAEVDPEWLERQAQVLQDAYGQDHDPHYRHPHLTEIDPDWLERQSQVLQNAYAQGYDPYHRHPHLTEVDPEYLERQAQVLQNAYAQDHDPHLDHPHVSELDPEELGRRAEELIAAYARGEDPLAAEEIAADDLKRIEGIGPKISGLLQQAGLVTFAQLAETEVGRLQQILDEAGVRLAAPDTWPEQAQLAAAGKWDELKTLQARLKGGRRT